MDTQAVIDIGVKTLETMVLVGAPMLGAGLIIGILVSIFQAVTSIQDMTLTFVPKILAVVIALIIFFPWMLNVMMSFTIELFNNLPNCAH